LGFLEGLGSHRRRIVCTAISGFVTAGSMAGASGVFSLAPRRGAWGFQRSEAKLKQLSAPLLQEPPMSVEVAGPSLGFPPGFLQNQPGAPFGFSATRLRRCSYRVKGWLGLWVSPDSASSSFKLSPDSRLRSPRVCWRPCKREGWR
jgi:hypothetical protein